MSGTFFLGLGGQKCGSSWIQAYLARQPGSDFGRLGEYQVWEHRLGGVFARYAVMPPSRTEQLRARVKRAFGGSEPAAHLRWRLQQHPGDYWAYFDSLLTQPDVVRTGDVTPSYAALTAPLLDEIQSGFTKRDIAVKVVFAMRDPVARLDSHLRMEVAKGRVTRKGTEAERLRSFYASDEATARSRYDRTLSVVDTCVAPEDLHLCLFEDMFTPKGISALAAFAGVAEEPEAGAKAVNARAKGEAVPNELAAEIAAHYRPVYEAVAERLPQVAHLWPSARYVLE